MQENVLEIMGNIEILPQVSNERVTYLPSVDPAIPVA
jgi:hypothetical protein